MEEPRPTSEAGKEENGIKEESPVAVKADPDVPKAAAAIRHSARQRKVVKDDDFVPDFDPAYLKRLEKALEKDDKDAVEKTLTAISSGSDASAKRRKRKSGSDDEGYEIRPRRKRKPSSYETGASSARREGEAAGDSEGTGESTPSRPMTFQEAAVWVMLDQRKKGVLALSAKTTWDCIVAYGLNVARSCRTPVQSLSSRMSEDVKKNSATSTFVRVGDGLYTLRADYDKFDYTQYTSTKVCPSPVLPAEPVRRSYYRPRDDDSPDESDDPTPTDGAKEKPRRTRRPSSRQKERDEGDDDDEDEDEDDEDDDIEEDDEDDDERPARRRSTPKKSSPRTPQQGPVNTDDFLVWAWSKSKRTAPQWAGMPTEIAANGDVYYGGVIIAGENFRVGDCLFLNGEYRSRGKRPIRQIAKLWQSASDGDGKKNLAARMLVECVRYVYPEDTPDGRSSKHDKHEVFLTDAVDVYTVEELAQEVYSLVDILQWPQYREIDLRKVQGDVLCCRTFFSLRTGQLHPLTMAKNGFCELRAKSDDDKTQQLARPKGWPEDVQFRNKNSPEDEHNTLFQSQRNEAVYLLSIVKPGEAPITNLCAAKKLQPNDVIGEFVGRLYRIAKNADSDKEDSDEEEEEDEDEEGGSKRPNAKPGPFKVKVFEDETETVVIDASEEGNETRFIQNSRSTPAGASSAARLTPNVKFVPARIGGQWHVYVIASKEIRSGEVLIGDFEALGAPNKFPWP